MASSSRERCKRIESPSSNRQQSKSPHQMSALLDSLSKAPLEIDQEQLPRNLKSKIVAVEVDSPNGARACYHIHSALLCKTSEKFKTAFTGHFQEAITLKITIEERVRDFEQYIDYMYSKSDWKPRVTCLEDFMDLASLYAMGEELMDKSFQKPVFHMFCERAEPYLGSLSQEDWAKTICRLLRIASEDVAPRRLLVENDKYEEPFREYIFRLAASEILSFNQTNEFRKLVDELPEAVLQISTKMGLAVLTPCQWKAHYDRVWESK